ncbi:hypothetical protein RND71_028577 [Anisodus tanguticus]|uniref:Uncharacterized protein n=1 Tax=Anisodus tanguticus TaxID=243964 RepID=A0AAE1RL02_9SOLA|nr:hypothetical protein RND71_028577 [Anisodus tanguticus]
MARAKVFKVQSHIALPLGSRLPLRPKTDQRRVGNLSLVFGIRHQEVHIALPLGSRLPLHPKTDQRRVGNLSLVFGIRHQELQASMYSSFGKLENPAEIMSRVRSGSEGVWNVDPNAWPYCFGKCETLAGVQDILHRFCISFFEFTLHGSRLTQPTSASLTQTRFSHLEYFRDFRKRKEHTTLTRERQVLTKVGDTGRRMVTMGHAGSVIKPKSSGMRARHGIGRKVVQGSGMTRKNEKIGTG